MPHGTLWFVLETLSHVNISLALKLCVTATSLPHGILLLVVQLYLLCHHQPGPTTTWWLLSFPHAQSITATSHVGKCLCDMWHIVPHHNLWIHATCHSLNHLTQSYAATCHIFIGPNVHFIDLLATCLVKISSFFLSHVLSWVPLCDQALSLKMCDYFRQVTLLCYGIKTCWESITWKMCNLNFNTMVFLFLWANGKEGGFASKYHLQLTLLVLMLHNVQPLLESCSHYRWVQRTIFHH